MPNEARSLARTFGQPVPEGQLTLNRSGEFEVFYRGNTSVHRRGNYWADGETVDLLFRGETKPVHARLKHGCLCLDGATYARPGAPAPASTPDPQPPILVVAAPIEPVRVEFSAVGAWTVHRAGVEDPNTKMVFSREGGFTFSGHGATSRGRYEVHGGTLKLIWTHIDEEPVEAGTIQKEIPLALDGTSFEIDNYHYERATK